jgi:hypothetical protein
MLRDRRGVIALAALAGLAVATGVLHGADDPARMISDGFETPSTVWEQEQTDAVINLYAHDRTRRAAHEGQLSEHFQFDAGPGSSYFCSYRLPKVPAASDLRVSFYVRANRAGVRVYGRVILPTDTDPETGQPSFVLVPGTIYENVDRWQRIELAGLPPLIESQARVIRASTRRPVKLEGAYLDRIVVNLYCGAGQTEVFLDELKVGPVPAEVVAAHSRPDAVDAEAASPEVGETPGTPPSRVGVVLERNRLKRSGADWFVTAIEAPGADVAELRKAGFDLFVDSINADPARFRAAVDAGFLLQPNLVALEGEPLEPAQALAAAAAFPLRDKVAFWGLGDQLGRVEDPDARKAELDRVRSIKSGFRGLPRDFSHLTTGTVADGFSLYAQAPKHLDILAVRPNSWGSAQAPGQTYAFLAERRSLTARANPNGFFFAWLPAAPPPEVQKNVWGEDPPPSWGFPMIQPEQLRVYAFVAMAAGYRGIGFRGNADLSRNDLGKMLLIEMALLNEEIHLFESILAQGKDPIPLYFTYPSDPPALPPPGSLGVNQKIRKIKEPDHNAYTRFAAIDLSDRRGALLLVNDYFDAGQYQASQMAMNDLKITVPARESAQAWLISPGGLQVLDREKVPGGVRFNVTDYGPTAMILVTTDLSLPDRIQAEVERVRPLAVQLAIEQARIQFKWVADINGRLLADGHPLYDPTDPKAYKLPPNMPAPNDEASLLAKSDELIKSAEDALEREDYPVAWAEARRATRPLRLLMLAHWTRANEAMVRVAAPYPEDLPERRLSISVRNQVPKKPKKPPKPLVLPIACPPLVAFNLLPQSWIWIDWMRRSFGPNLVPSGTFDQYKTLSALEAAGWVDVSRDSAEITTKVETVPSTKDETKRILKLSVLASDPKRIDRLPPTLDILQAAIRSPEVKVKAGQFIRISVDVGKNIYHSEGHGGVIVRDSIGGEPLQFRYNNAVLELTPVVLFRRAPVDGTMTVTLGLAAYGEAYFNNFKVQVVEGPAATPPADFAGPTPRLPNPAAEFPASAGTATRTTPVPRINR